MATTSTPDTSQNNQTCDQIAGEEWVQNRYPGRCYFYPGRDCPGWEYGRPCGRIGLTIEYPEDS